MALLSSPRPRPRSPARATAGLLAALLAAGLAGPASAEREYGKDEKVGVEERLGAVVPKDLEFKDESGATVRLGDLITKPTVLTLVYLRCPNICSPLMHEVAKTVDKVDLVPGIDYDLITVSFDDRETPELAATAKKNLLAERKKPVPPEAWRFLTGDAKNILALTDAVGFRFRKEDQDFVHAATVIFLTKDGKIVRYLGGLTLFPMDLKMAVLDATEGRTRSLIDRVQKICYSYDPEGKSYVFQVNRIVLFVTLLGLGIFGLVLWLKRKRHPDAVPAAGVATPGRNA